MHVGLFVVITLKSQNKFRENAMGFSVWVLSTKRQALKCKRDGGMFGRGCQSWRYFIFHTRMIDPRGMF